MSQVGKLRNEDINIGSVRKITYRRMKTEMVRKKLSLEIEDGNKKIMRWVTAFC